MQISKTSYNAIVITGVVHIALVAVFAFTQIEFNAEKDWSYINMSLREIEPFQTKPVIEKVKIPENYEEKGLDAKKYSVAKTNEAVNEATNELSKAQKAELDQEIAKQVEDMARQESTTDLGKKGAGSLEGKISATKKSKVKPKESGAEGTSDLGNKHNEATNISYYLKNRTEGLIGLNNPIYVCEGGGVVVVNIAVNRFGEVVNASVNSSKTETNDRCLQEAAKQAALTSSFNEDLAAASKQQGTITYNFIGQ